MIADFLIGLPALLINAILQVLPVGGTVPQDFVTSVYSIWGYVNEFSIVVPVQTLLTVLALAMAFHLGILVFNIIHWIITKIPFIG